ncbi:hypothetical protein NQ176_g3619 [Zarea fungicola]|uniref:Uncharacterized protein n=1 Tax=Zarea fungicola TaxID=93591 RepID=A0ACC1NIR4_9HYPO|nr:hypothetical protein NQ176_g3619 [Lecanicillium fungicola]
MVSFSTIFSASAALVTVTAATPKCSGGNTACFSSYPGFGQNLTDTRHFSQAVRIGRYVQLAGQNGWDSSGNIPSNFTTQVENMYTNIDTALKVAGSRGLQDVISIRTFIVGTGADFLARAAEHSRVRELRMPGQLPTSTSVGITALVLAGTLIEVEAEAWIE